MTGLLALAIIPGIVLMVYIYKQDKVEKEPGKLMVKLFLFGVISVIPAIILEMIGEDLILGGVADETGASLALIAIDNFIVVGLSEELSKYVMLKLGSWKNKAFDYKFDAVVYAVVTSMGFAIFENIFYVLENGFANGIIRALVSLPGHATFGVCMGVFYGQAKFYEARGNKEGMKRNLFKAVFFPTLMHGFFDFCLSTDSTFFLILFFVYVVVMDIVCIKKIKKHSSEDTRLSVICDNILVCETDSNVNAGNE